VTGYRGEPPLIQPQNSGDGFRIAVSATGSLVYPANFGINYRGERKIIAGKQPEKRGIPGSEKDSTE